jgi:hypothetical protein
LAENRRPQVNPSNLFPYVVPKAYFRIPVRGKKQPTLDKWGVVEPIGPDLFQMLVDASDGMVRNVHEEDLRDIGLSVKKAQAKAAENLRALVEDGEEIERSLSISEEGLGQIAWMGHWLTASCIVLPELHSWASELLKTEKILVSVPQQQFMFMFSVGDADFRKQMRRYVKKVVGGMEKLITFDLFLLTRRGLKPYEEPGKV